jgi:hypothetical protein
VDALRLVVLDHCLIETVLQRSDVDDDDLLFVLVYLFIFTYIIVMLRVSGIM